MIGFKKIVAAAALALSAGAASATPVQWSGNGHWYEFIAGSFKAPAAFADAATKTWLGETGYVVTITSALEQSFVNALAGGSRYWIGASDAATEGVWKWVAGEEAGQTLSYTNWLPGQPNNQFGDQDYAFSFNSGTWDDVKGTNTAHLYGYIVEYYGTLPAVPAPAGLPLAAGALGLLAMLKRRKKA